MRTYFLFLVSVVSVQISAGNEPTKPRMSRGIPAFRATEEPSKLGQIISERNIQWSFTNITKEVRSERIIDYYQKNLDSFEKPEDFIKILDNTKNMSKTTDEFISKNLNEFFKKSPTLDQIKKLDFISTSFETAVEIKKAALPFVKTPYDFLELIKISNDKPNQDYKLSITNFIKINLKYFAELNPTIDEIVCLQAYLISIQVTKNSTIEALIALKNEFMNKFTGDDFIKILSYGCEPAKEYKKEVENLIDKHLKYYLKTAPSLAQTHKLIQFTRVLKTTMAIKEYQLKLVARPRDFITVAQPLVDAPSDQLKQSLTNFIRKNLAIYKNTDPTIDDIMALQQLIFVLQVDLDKTIAALIKLKDIFIKDFSGTDFIRLLSYGCDNPNIQYKEQLASLKIMHDIDF